LRALLIYRWQLPSGALDPFEAVLARRAARSRGLLMGSADAVMARHEHQDTRGHMGRSDHGRGYARPNGPPGCKESCPCGGSGRWSVRMEGYGGPAQPSPTIGQCLNGGYGWLEIECCRCKTRASMPLDAIRRARDTSIWKLEPSFRCRSCGTRRYKPPVRMIKLTEQREITPYEGVHPDEER
jgi:hypothetical protein